MINLVILALCLMGRAMTALVSTSVENKTHNMDWVSYHSLEDIYDWFDYLANKHDFCQIESIGKSFENRDMRVMKVCQGGCGDKPSVWIDSGIHAVEWIGPAVGTWMLRELVENNSDHPDLTEMLDWYFLPVLNPDGYHLTRQNNVTRWWRKSTSGNPNISGFPSVDNDLSVDWLHSFGVDLNRNFDYLWGTTGGLSPNSSRYPGPAAFSEVETRNVRDFILSNRDQIKLFISLHSLSQMILTPGNKSVAASKEVEDLATEANKALESVNGEIYTVGCGECLLYPVSGDSHDWAYWTVGIPYAYVIELRPTQEIANISGGHLPEEQIIPNAKEVWAWHMVAARKIIEEFCPCRMFNAKEPKSSVSKLSVSFTKFLVISFYIKFF